MMARGMKCLLLNLTKTYNGKQAVDSLLCGAVKRHAAQSMGMSSRDDYPNLIDNTDQTRCGNCNAFCDGFECHRCGHVHECHCGELRPVRTTREGSDGTTYYSLRCECTGTGRAWVW